ncbi:MAG: hypothetical protein IKX20_02980 [Paludibacteraceae bacterium]|nr:hypothetical protein [Paludibacteraceae bacterium]
MAKGTSKAGGGGAKSKVDALQAHFDKENARVEEFLNGRGADDITMDNGQIIERYTMKDMKNLILKEAKNNPDQTLTDDDAIVIQYTDGTIAYYGGGDDTSKMKLTNINGVIYENANTSAYAGKGVKIENYKQLYPKDYPDSKGYEDDWRLDFY